VERAAAAAAQRGLRVFLLGAQPGVAEATSDILCARYPGLIIAGTYAGSPAPAEDDALVALVNKATPDILFVAYGAPQQDLWIARNRERLNTGVAVGVGGAFDFISGRRRRAPRWVQRIGMEWLFRLYKEPWRWRRMLALPRFAWAVLREKYSPLDNVG
jgi:N-acetylglucosaminyldiphosphoundecaprenol N-acetyl-beta-D-mannosaminyltransferase